MAACVCSDRRSGKILRLLLQTGAAVLIACSGASAGDAPAAGGMTLFPIGDLYPPYAADPHRVGFGVQWLSFADTAIPFCGNSRVALRAGGRFGLLRGAPDPGEAGGWQVSIEGGFNAQFDADHSLDNIGWDGRYGLVMTGAPAAQGAFKIGVLHDSSHVGDEYMERTGWRRIGYTRHEVVAGGSWSFDKGFRVYGEAGWGYELSNDRLQEPGRVQAGLEYAATPFPVSGWAWYGAVDLSAMQERDWRVDRSVQAGMTTQQGGRQWRVGIEWYRGRPPMGEFFQYTEEYLSLGIWIDI